MAMAARSAALQPRVRPCARMRGPGEGAVGTEEKTTTRIRRGPSGRGVEDGRDAEERALGFGVFGLPREP